MGIRGPKSSAPGGYGTISNGYRRMWIASEKRQRLEHDLVWEAAHGPIPPGMDIHHVNLDKLDNRLENLALIDRETHRRVHGGCQLRDGVWWKPCSVCGAFKPIDAVHFYLSREGYPLYGRCRPCHIAIVVASKQRRRAERRAAGIS